MAVASSNCQDKGMGDTRNTGDKAERLAKALRDNLKRRKAQARESMRPAEAKPRND